MYILLYLILLYYTYTILLLYIILYIYYILYYILYYTLLQFIPLLLFYSFPFFSSSPHPLLSSIPPNHSIRVGSSLSLFIFSSSSLPFPLPILFSSPLLSFSSSTLLFLPSQSFLLFPTSYSFNTCRYLHILIYIPSQYSRISDPACFIGVDG